MSILVDPILDRVAEVWKSGPEWYGGQLAHFKSAARPTSFMQFRLEYTCVQVDDGQSQLRRQRNLVRTNPLEAAICKIGVLVRRCRANTERILRTSIDRLPGLGCRGPFQRREPTFHFRLERP